MKKIYVTTKNIDLINFYCESEIIKKEKYLDIYNNKYDTIIGEYTFYEDSDKYICKENIKIKDEIISTNYIKINLSIKRQTILNKSDSEIYNELRTFNEFGKVDIGFQVWSEKDWKELDFDTNDGKRCLIYDCFDGKYRIFGKSKFEISNTSIRNGRNYLSFIKINEDNIEFAEKYLGIMNNKSISSIDSADDNIRKILINRFRKILIDNFSSCTLDNNHKSGIKNWSEHTDVIKTIFVESSNKKKIKTEYINDEQNDEQNVINKNIEKYNIDFNNKVNNSDSKNENKLLKKNSESQLLYFYLIKTNNIYKIGRTNDPCERF
jgi:hypothetical protein